MHVIHLSGLLWSFANLLFPSNPVDLPESEKLTLSLCVHKDRSSAWKAIYFECLSQGKHFLEQVLVSTFEIRSFMFFLFVVCCVVLDVLDASFQPRVGKLNNVVMRVSFR